MGGGLCRPAVLERNPNGELKHSQSWWQRMRDKQRLIRAVEEGDVDKVKELLERMPEEQINFVPLRRDFLKCECMDPPKRENCALLVAAITRNTQLVTMLLEYKAFPDTTNEAGQSALVVACENCDEPIVFTLLEHDADANIPSPSGSFPLHISASHKSLPIAKALLAHGADVNLRDASQDTVLHILIGKKGDLWDDDETLAKSSAKIRVPRGADNDDVAPASEPLVPVEVGIARLVLATKHVDFRLRDAKHDTALIKATKYSRTVLVVDFVNAGAETNLLDAKGWAALHVAIKLWSNAGTAMALHIIQAEQTDVNLVTAKGITPLQLSVTTTNLKVAEALLGRSADPNKLSAGAAPLHTALTQVPVERGPMGTAAEPCMSERIALAILRCGRADINLTDGKSLRPVFLSVSCCSTAVLEELIKQSVRLDVREDNWTPMLLAVSLACKDQPCDAAADGLQGLTKRAAMLVKADTAGLDAVGGPKEVSALHLTAAMGVGNLQLFKQLMSAKADCNVLSKAGETPLHAAIRAHDTVQHSVEAAIIIVKSGRAKVDLRTKANQETALTLAAARHLDTVMSELVVVADVNLANASGDTAMHLACRPLIKQGAKPEWGPKPAMVMLGSKKLKLSISNGQGQTPLHTLASTARWWKESVEVAAAAVKQGTCTLNTLDKAGLTALHYSLGCGTAGALTGLGSGPAMALHIINAPDCDVNLPSKDKAAEAAIHRSSILGLPDVCRALLSRKAQVNTLSGSGQLPLHLAISAGTSEGHASVAEQLIDCADCDVNLVVPATGQTPLLMSVLRCKVALVERLIKRGADPNAPDKEEDTALHAALRAAGKDIGTEGMALAIIGCAKADVNITSPAGDSALHAAVSACATQSLAALIGRKAKLDVLDAEGCTPLHRAAYVACAGREKGAEERAVMLVRGGANCDIADRQSRVALHIATGHKKGSLTLFNALLQAKANLDMQDAEKRTPLITAAYHLADLADAAEMATTLITSGRANLDLQATGGWTALMVVTEANHLALVKALLAAKASPNIANSSRDTALTLAAARHLDAVMSELVVVADVNLANASGDTAMHLACRPLIKQGAKPEWGPKPAMVMLGSKKLKLSISNGQGQTPLHTLASTARWWKESVEVAAAAVKQGTCTLNTLDKAGLTALHYSLGCGPALDSLAGLGSGPAMALHIINAPDCDVNLPSKDKAAEAAIHRCSILGLPDVCRALLSRKAQVNTLSGSGQLPLHLAISSGHGAEYLSVAEQLIGHDGCDVDLTLPSTGQSPLLMAVLHCKLGLVERLIKRGANPNMADKEKDTPLHAALRVAGGSETAKAGLLMSLALIGYNRVDVDAKNPAGSAPVHLAVQLPSLDVTKALISRNADLKAYDQLGQAALHHAITLDTKKPGAEYESCALALIQGGADPSQANLGDRDTPLHIVLAGSGNQKIFKALADHQASANAINGKGFTPLHLAIASSAAAGGPSNKYDEMAVVIIKAPNTDVNIVTVSGKESPLLLSARHLRRDVLRGLLARRADPNVPSSEGDFPLINLLQTAEDTGSDATRDLACSLAKDVITCGFADVDVLRVRDRASPAHFVTRLGDLDLMQALVKQQAKLNIQDTEGCSVLHIAAVMACARHKAGLPMMKLLVSCAAAANLQDKKAQTPLLISVTHHGGSLPAVKCVLDQDKVDIGANLLDSRGFTALHHAIMTCSQLNTDKDKEKQQVMVEIALAIVRSRKANLDTPTPDGSSPTLLAVKHCPAASVVAELAAGGANVAAANEAQEVPLLLALDLAGGAQRTAVLQEMALALANCPSVQLNAQCAKSGECALHKAVRLGFAALVDACLARKANLNIADKAGQIPLHLAMRLAIQTGDHTRLAIALNLINNGSNVDAVDPQSARTALHIAIAHEGGSQQLFEAVMKRSPKLDAVDGKGCTPLHYAVILAAQSSAPEPFVNMGTSLLRAGANANVPSAGYEGKTALHLSICTAPSGCRALFNKILALQGMDANAKDSAGITPCHAALTLCAAKHDQASAHAMALALIQSGKVDHSIPDPQGRPLLSRCVGFALPDLVAVLLGAGARIDVVDPETKLVPLLQSACSVANAAWKYGEGASSLQDRPRTLLTLIQSSAVDANATDNEGNTALHVLLAKRDPTPVSCGLLEKLLQRRPNLGIRNRAQDTPLHVAMKVFHAFAPAELSTPVITAMVKAAGPTMSVPDANGNTPLHLAYNCNNPVYAASLAAATEFNSLNNDGLAVLHLLVLAEAATQRIDALLKCRGCNVNLQTGHSRDSALHLVLRPAKGSASNAAWRTECVRLLMRHKADVNGADGSGVAPLMLLLRPAVKFESRVNLAMEMLDAGAKACNQLDPDMGMGWIHFFCDQPSCIKKWKQQGGNLNLTANFNEVTGFVRRNWGNGHQWNRSTGKVADAVFHNMNNQVTAITLAALGGWTTSVSTLASLGVSPNVEGVCGAKAVSPLMVALMQGDTDAASKLVSLGACVNGEADGVHPLSMCIQIAKGLFGQGAASYNVDMVPQVVANKVYSFAMKQAAEMVGDIAADVNDAAFEEVGNAAGDHIGGEVMNELGTEIGTEMGMMLFDAVLPGVSLLRWGWKLMNAAMDEGGGGRGFSEALTLAYPDTMQVAKWLLQSGTSVGLNDSGMKELVCLIASSDDGEGWRWAGLPLSWPSSFEPQYSNGMRSIAKKYQALIDEEESEGRSGSSARAQQAQAEQRWKATVKVSKTLQAINSRARR